jgi:hypothetical protein
LHNVQGGLVQKLLNFWNDGVGKQMVAQISSLETHWNLAREKPASL